MDSRPVIWDASNRRHLIDDHQERGLSQADIEEVMNNVNLLEIPHPHRNSTLVVVQTKRGRWLVVAWVDHPNGRFPIHARPASRRLIRRLTNER